MKNTKRLSELCVMECAEVRSLLCEGAMRRRLLDLGIIPGTRMVCVGKSPLGDPRAYAVRGKVIAIRKRDADKVILE